MRMGSGRGRDGDEDRIATRIGSGMGTGMGTERERGLPSFHRHTQLEFIESATIAGSIPKSTRGIVKVSECRVERRFRQGILGVRDGECLPNCRRQDDRRKVHELLYIRVD